MTEEKKENIEEGAPICQKCGNVMIWEPISDTPGLKDDIRGEWLCPHCQGEINFLGEDDE